MPGKKRKNSITRTPARKLSLDIALGVFPPSPLVSGGRCAFCHKPLFGARDIIRWCIVVIGMNNYRVCGDCQDNPTNMEMVHEARRWQKKRK
jgi:hypothetical protein